MKTSDFRVAFTRPCAKDLAKLKKRNPQALIKAKEAFGKLERNHEAGHALSGALGGCRSLEFSVKRSGAYRAVYVPVAEEAICVVFLVATHENVYDAAARRASRVLADPIGALTDDDGDE